MILWRIFEKQGRTEIALYFFKLELLPSLNKGVTLTIFNSSGKVPFSNKTLNT